MKLSFISIIVPVFNDPQGLINSINSLINQEYPSNSYEIIVVDNKSIDNTYKIIKYFNVIYPKLIKIVSENNIQSPASARNKGIRKSKGEVLAFIDSDMTVEKKWLRKINESIIKNNYNYIGYRVNMTFKTKNIFSLYNIITGFPTEKYLTLEHYSPTGCLIAKRFIFDTVGFFDRRLISGEDNEFGKRVYAYGYKQFYDPNISINHPADISLKKSLKRWFRSGRGSFQKYLFYPSIFSHLNLKILNPYNYFPPKPSKFITIVKDSYIWQDISMTTKLCLYFVHWMVKIIRMAGYIYEKSRRKT
ncbi:MAG: glycosyltransferase [Actinomycetia bacterium]|nr:glycosyltransferase [Actinomycetes bacterium]